MNRPSLRFFNMSKELTSHLVPFSITGKMPVPQRVNFLVEQAFRPVHKKLIENGATSQLTHFF